MRIQHQFDPDFSYVSPTLKKAVHLIGECRELNCLDVPAGNGRNVFYLASHFKRVSAVDLNSVFINNISTDSLKYNLKAGTITSSILNLEKEMPLEIKNTDFIVTIHYYNYTFISIAIEQMKKGAYFFIETPNCNGENYLSLPTELELDNLFKNGAIIFLEKHCCKSNKAIKNTSFKCLFRK